MKKYIAPIVFGAVGAAILFTLGAWQFQRMQWKKGVLEQIDRVILADPVALPENINKAQHQFLPVKLSGAITEDEIDVLGSVKKIGPGYRIISAFVTDDGRRIMLDRGYVVTRAKEALRPATVPPLLVTCIGPMKKAALFLILISKRISGLPAISPRWRQF